MGGFPAVHGPSRSRGLSLVLGNCETPSPILKTHALHRFRMGGQISPFAFIGFIRLLIHNNHAKSSNELIESRASHSVAQSCVEIAPDDNCPAKFVAPFHCVDQVFVVGQLSSFLVVTHLYPFDISFCVDKLNKINNNILKGNKTIPISIEIRISIKMRDLHAYNLQPSSHMYLDIWGAFHKNISDKNHCKSIS